MKLWPVNFHLFFNKRLRASRDVSKLPAVGFTASESVRSISCHITDQQPQESTPTPGLFLVIPDIMASNVSECTTPKEIILDLELQNAVEDELAIHNDQEEINRQLIQVNELNSRVMIRTTLETIAYGTFKTKPAALVVFQSQFLHSTSYRIKFAIIRLSFSDSAKPTDMSQAPRIVSLFPMHARGPESFQTETVKNTVGANVDLGRIVVGASAGAMANREYATSGDRRRFTEINGIITTTKRKFPRAENRALWTIDENVVAQDGVPRFFGGAVILEYDRPFQMEIEVEVRQSVPNGRAFEKIVEVVRKSKRGNDDPVMFVPRQPYSSSGKPLSDDFDGLSLKDIIGDLAGLEYTYVRP